MRNHVLFFSKTDFSFPKVVILGSFSRLFVNEADLRKTVCYSNLCDAARALVESNAQNTVRASIIGHHP